MLNASRNREPLTRAVRASAVLAMLAVIIPVASATLTEQVVASTIAPAVLQDVPLSAPEPAPAQNPPAVAPRSVRRAAVPRATPVPAQQQPATLSGVLRDATGGVVPGVTVTLTDTASGMAYSTTSDGAGAFALRNLPPSSYQFRASLPGFATITNAVTLSSGENLQTKLEMRVGALFETVTVVCPVGGAALAPRAAPAVLAFDSRPATTRLFAQQVVPVRVGGNIAAPRRIKVVQPACPGNLPGNGFVVTVEGTIGVDGLVGNIGVLRPKPGDQQQDAIVQSAMDVVRQWEYTPARLNNVPIAVIVTVTVTYVRQ